MSSSNGGGWFGRGWGRRQRKANLPSSTVGDHMLMDIDLGDKGGASKVKCDQCLKGTHDGDHYNAGLKLSWS